MVVLRSRKVTTPPTTTSKRSRTRRASPHGKSKTAVAVRSTRSKTPSPRTREATSPPRARVTRSRAEAISHAKGADWVYTPQEVNDASITYANALNAAPLTPVVKAILDQAPKSSGGKFVAAPYIFIDRDFIHYEDKSKRYTMYPMVYPIKPPSGKKYSLEADEDNMKVLLEVVALSVHSILYNAGMGHRHKRFAGMLGIQIGVSVGQHYIAYIYDNGKFSFFDSGDPKQCDKQQETNNTYIILMEALRLTVPSTTTITPICNTGVFETAAGVSEDVFNYIGQNIFCHSWSLWFLYQSLVLGKTMSQIDEMAGTGIHADRDNLWLIKRFVYTTIIPLARQTSLYRKETFKPFTFYIDDPDYRSGKFVSVKSRATKNRIVLPIPELPVHTA